MTNISSDLLKKLYDIFSDFNDLNVNYAVMRAFELSESGDDVDLLCFDDDIERIECALKKFNAIKVDAKLYCPHIQFHIPVLVDETIEYLVLDFFVDFIFGRKGSLIPVIVDKKNYLDSMIIDVNEIKWCSLEYQYYFLSVHVFLEKSTNAVRDKELSALSDNIDVKKLYFICLFSGIFVGDYSQFQLKSIKKYVSKIKVYNFFGVKNVYYLLLKIKSFIKRKFIVRKGLIVTFVGVDGCGKSSIVAGLELIFTKKNIKKYYMGDIKPVGVINGLKGSVDSQSAIYGFLKLVRMAGYLFNRYLLSFEIFFLSQNKIILFDRHLYDRLVPSANTISVNKFHCFLLKVINAVTLGPDLVFFVSGNPHVIAERKREYSVSKTRRAIKFQEEVLNFSVNEFVGLDSTSMSKDRLVEYVSYLIANKIRSKILNA